MSPVKNPHLHRYWIEFEREQNRPRQQFWPACGVTAYTREDALMLIQARVYGQIPMPPVSLVLEDVDLSRLDSLWHPNIGISIWSVQADVSRATAVWRGVWYPFNGYELRLR